MQVSQDLKRLDVNKGTGSDAIHPMFLRKCYQQWAEPMAILFSKSSEFSKLSGISTL